MLNTFIPAGHYAGTHCFICLADNYQHKILESFKFEDEDDI